MARSKSAPKTTKKAAPTKSTKTTNSTVKTAQPKSTSRAKKAPVKTTAKTAPVTTPVHETKQVKAPRIRMRKSWLIALLALILIGGLVYLLRGYFVVATVNGQPISRIALINELEQQYGKQALNTLITKRLIEQEASKKHITVSQQEVKDEEKKIEDRLASSGQKLDDALAQQGMTRQMLDDQLRLQKIAEKINGNGITVTDKEVNDYIEKNKDSLPQDSKPEDLKKTVKDQLMQQKLNAKIQSWVESLQNNAKITRFVNY